MATASGTCQRSSFVTSSCKGQSFVANEPTWRQAPGKFSLSWCLNLRTRPFYRGTAIIKGLVLSE